MKGFNLCPADLETFAGCKIKTTNKMKQTLIALVIIALSAIQGLLLGLNGLTIISIPMTIYLGLLVIEKITETKETNI